MSNDHLTIAIDGPVASGKTAVGKEVSTILKIRFLDTGIMYRALSVAAIKENIDPADEIELCRLAKTILVEFDDNSNLAKSIKINGYDVTSSLRNTEVNDVEESMRLGVLDCTECGVCTYVCPSKIELSSKFSTMKAQLYKEANA